MKTFIFAFLLSSVALAADFQKAKIVDIQPFNGPGLVIGNIIGNAQMFTLTVAFDDYTYSANYYVGSQLKPQHLVVGDPILARIDGDRLVIRQENGKEAKAKIIRKAHLTAQLSQQSASH
jgi:hypothetical protein